MGKKAKRLYSGYVCKACCHAFANRRQFAYIVDSLALFFASLAVGYLLEVDATVPAFLIPVVGVVGFNIVFIFAQNGVFALKDGFRGKSSGRLLCGVTVVAEDSREPIGFGASFKRNLPTLIPFAWLVIMVQMLGGKRLGDGWARTRVVWDKFRHQFPFEDRGFICLGCGYDLRGNVSGVCPECGMAVAAPHVAKAAAVS